jgi:hypothetical protein
MSEVNVSTWVTPIQTDQNNLATRHRRDLPCPSNYWSSESYNMADNKKQEKDFTKEVDALLPEADATIQVLQSFNEITTLD